MRAAVGRLPKPVIAAGAAVGLAALMLAGGVATGVLGSSGLAGRPGAAGAAGAGGTRVGAVAAASPTPGRAAAQVAATPSIQPTPWQPSIPPHPDQIVGKAAMQTSNCLQGYEPGATCYVHYTGRYYLQSHDSGKIVIEVSIDGITATSQTYTCPKGGKGFYANLKFKVPQHAKEIDYKSFLETSNGQILASAVPQVTFGYG